jgi:hypothetical protein
MRAIARERSLDLDLSVAAFSELDAHLGTGYDGVVLVGPHLGADFDLIDSRAHAAGASALLLSDAAASPSGAGLALDALVAHAGLQSGENLKVHQHHPIEGTLRA